MKCTPTKDQKSPHKTVKLCVFTVKSSGVHDTFSNWGDTQTNCSLPLIANDGFTWKSMNFHVVKTQHVAFYQQIITKNVRMSV